MHLVAFHPRHRLGQRDVAKLADQPFENPAADLRVRHLASPEEDRRFDLVPVFQEALDVAGAITPVPGGVGQMTVACLLVNTLRAARAIHKLPAPAV